MEKKPQYGSGKQAAKDPHPGKDHVCLHRPDRFESNVIKRQLPRKFVAPDYNAKSWARVPAAVASPEELLAFASRVVG
jgi:hypothetical protein